jgi:histidinol dehydrogenase
MKAHVSPQTTMKKIKFPAPRSWKKLTERPSIDSTDMSVTVEKIFSEIRQNGDAAVAKYTRRFDKVSIAQTRISAAEIKAVSEKLPKDLKTAMQLAASNIHKFHAAQIEKPKVIRTMKGVYCWRESRPIENVGIYIPGGSAPLFSTALMLASRQNWQDATKLFCAHHPIKMEGYIPRFSMPRNLPVSPISAWWVAYRLSRH